MNRWQLLGQMPGIQLAETGQGAESGTSKPASNALLSSATKQGLPKILDGHTVNTMAWVTRERARQPTSANLEESVKPLDGILIPSVELYNFHHRHSITGDREGQIISNNLNLKEII
ncbi:MULTISPECIES: hypothetical protein [Pseudomonas]|uniref:hypothetical protein n=2 Tax=Pseudomonas TaxID=286 RepID=UPI0021C6F8EA|nr:MULTISPECIES: hypothetical protein [Pseudomonas]MCU0211258.1 hypothetical protein [Pseudomonas shahriarae]